MPASLRIDQSYKRVFDDRGIAYQQAMFNLPASRYNEFNSLFARKPLKRYESILDIPSGGGYLSSFIQRKYPELLISVTSVDFSESFITQNTSVGLAEENMFLYDSKKYYDRFVCLAASHHISDINFFLEGLRPMAKEGAIFHIADVFPDSNIAKFLDVFVDSNTSTGHEGIYRDYALFDLPGWLEPINIEIRHCPWVFQNQQQMLAFCSSLFGLNPNLEKVALLQALNEYIGIAKRSKGIALNWELQYCEFKACT